MSSILEPLEQEVEERNLLTFVITPAMDDILLQLAMTGRLMEPWKLMMKLLVVKIYQILQKKFEVNGFVGAITQSFESRRDSVLSKLKSFEHVGPPFTIQRLAELLIQHEDQYRATHKLMNSIEKLLYVNMLYEPPSSSV